MIYLSVMCVFTTLLIDFPYLPPPSNHPTLPATLIAVILRIYNLVRLILIGERFSHNFQSLEIMGDLYQYTEAFCQYS